MLITKLSIPLYALNVGQIHNLILELWPQTITYQVLHPSLAVKVCPGRYSLPPLLQMTVPVVGGGEVGTVTGVMQVRPHPFEQQISPPVQSLSREHEITQAPKVVAGQRALVGGVETVEVVVGGAEVVVRGMTQVIPHPLEQQIRPEEQSALLEHAWTQRPKPDGIGQRASVVEVGGAVVEVGGAVVVGGDVAAAEIGEFTQHAIKTDLRWSSLHLFLSICFHIV